MRGMRWRLIDESGEPVGELPDAEATWSVGQQVTLGGQVWKVVGFGGLTAERAVTSDAPLLVVRRLHAS